MAFDDITFVPISYENLSTGWKDNRV
jgi:hypothetical protein